MLYIILFMGASVSLEIAFLFFTSSEIGIHDVPYIFSIRRRLQFGNNKIFTLFSRLVSFFFCFLQNLDLNSF